MRKTLSLLLVTSLGLSACGFGQSRINPVNWFGSSRQAPVSSAPEQTNPLIPERTSLFSRRGGQEVQTYAGRPFDQISNLTVEQVPGGALIRATGLAARQGYYAVQLTPANEAEEPVDGVLTYRLEGLRPARATPVGTTPTREVTGARKLTNQQLAGVRRIRVEGVQNALEVRR